MSSWKNTARSGTAPASEMPPLMVMLISHHQTHQDNKYYTLYLNIVQFEKVLPTALRSALNCTPNIRTCCGCNKVCVEQEDEVEESIRAGVSQEAEPTVAAPSDWENEVVDSLQS